MQTEKPSIFTRLCDALAKMVNGISTTHDFNNQSYSIGAEYEVLLTLPGNYEYLYVNPTNILHINRINAAQLPEIVREGPLPQSLVTINNRQGTSILAVMETPEELQERIIKAYQDTEEYDSKYDIEAGAISYSNKILIEEHAACCCGDEVEIPRKQKIVPSLEYI